MSLVMEDLRYKNTSSIYWIFSQCFEADFVLLFTAYEMVGLIEFTNRDWHVATDQPETPQSNPH